MPAKRQTWSEFTKNVLGVFAQVEGCESMERSHVVVFLLVFISKKGLQRHSCFDGRPACSMIGRRLGSRFEKGNRFAPRLGAWVQLASEKWYAATNLLIWLMSS